MSPLYRERRDGLWEKVRDDSLSDHLLVRERADSSREVSDSRAERSLVEQLSDIEITVSPLLQTCAICRHWQPDEPPAPWNRSDLDTRRKCGLLSWSEEGIAPARELPLMKSLEMGPISGKQATYTAPEWSCPRWETSPHSPVEAPEPECEAVDPSTGRKCAKEPQHEEAEGDRVHKSARGDVWTKRGNER